MKVLVCAPDIFIGDAVGNHCLGIARACERLGLAVELYAERFDAASARVRPLAELFAECEPQDVLLVSYSIFDPYLDKLAKLDCRKLCYFHGVTDSELLEAFEPRTAQLCRDAMQQLHQLSTFDLLIANSRFSARALAQHADACAIKVLPPVFADMPAFRHERRQDIATDRIRQLLVVGRVVPHKRVEDAIALLPKLSELGADALLSVVGSMPNYDYAKYLLNFARSQGVLTHVDFKGMLDDADLVDCFARADVLLVPSRHEGFCVPVLEAMHHGKPALVRAGTAAEELCAPSDILPSDSSADIWAAATHRLLSRDANDTSKAASMYHARAQAILSTTSDEEWLKLLTHEGESIAT
ncbi:glycosyl transferase family 2 [Trinickia symbiotica]|uniref:Glycosyl transferase family 2 n=1 Tax=Trinickia symbiotica TaxID=863227 RepID=A0A2T3XW31_9BURK|nr:glycosyltransferase [Trinickia symbiotica]PTB20708.1 glycosyl transferase family 2 [Trinickia symbiotica]